MTNSAPAAHPDRPQRVWIDFAIAALLFAAALALRFYLLDVAPPGLYNDEAAYALDAVGVTQGNHAIFFERNNGREPLFIYLLALAFELFGATPYTQRALAALLGALTVPAAYWLAAAGARFERPRLPNAPRWFGLWVALFLLFSYWHLAFSRLGFRAITLPLFMTLAFVFVWRAFRRLRDETTLPWSDLLLSGALLGVTFYTYTAGRVAIVVFAVAAALAWLRAAPLGFTRLRVFKATLVVLLIFAITIAPLLGYFVQHPASFGGRAVDVSIFSPEFAPEGPAAALLASGGKLLRMFWDAGDANLRHNPAQRPVVDMAMALWIGAGLILALVNWRRLTPLVYVAWVLLLVTPALFSAEGAPHSLRTIGLLPAIYVLAVGAMLQVGQTLFARRTLLAALLPLPFLLFSGATTVRDYFGAWQNPDRFRGAFMVDEVQLAEAVGREGGDDYWLLTLSPAYFRPGQESYTMQYIVGDRAAYANVPLNEAGAALTLGAIPADVARVNVLRPYEKPELTETSFVYLDSKGLLDFMLRRAGATLVPPGDTGGDTGEDTIGGIPYTTYSLPTTRDFSVPDIPERAPIDFGDAVQLRGAAFAGAGEAPSSEQTATAHARVSSDQPLWVALAFAALRPIDTDLKTSLTLADQNGIVVAQTDRLLASDRYPVARTWETGTATRSYAILDLPAALAPGEYTLHLRIYEEADGRVYPVQQSEGSPLQSAPIGTVEVTLPRVVASVTPPIALPHAAVSGFRLIGADALPDQAAPGERLPLALYWQAEATPAANLSGRVQLVDERGSVLAEATTALGSELSPTESWRVGETVRQLALLALPADLATGKYTLQAALLKDGAATELGEIGPLEVAGRQRLMTAPEPDLAASASFGGAVVLAGAQLPNARTLTPASTLELDLIWQPLRASAANLVRFAQLLDANGALIAQQDTVPCALACPASSWIAGEYLIDPVVISLPATLPAGEFQLVVGWYDAATLERLAGSDASGAPLPDNVFRVPLTWTHP